MANTVRRVRRLRPLALLFAISLVAASCGGDDDDGGGGTTTEGGQVAPTTAAPSSDPVEGGEVTYGLEAETNGGFCLQEAQLAIAGIQVARTIYDTLAAPNAEGEIVPSLAQSIEPNEDFSQWTITLREGITFHDGSALDAQIVKDNLDAYRGQYPARNPLLYVFVFQNIDTVEVVDPLTVQVNTKVPWVAFPWYLWGSARLGIMGRAQLDAADPQCANQLVGTGPFMLDHWTVNQEFVAVKNPNYWQTDENGVQLPYLDQITYRPIPEVAQRVNALESGQIDLMHTSDTEQIAQRMQPLADDGSIQLLQSDTFGEVNYLMLNVSKPPFDNKNARVAVAAGLDRRLLDDVRGGGIGTVADGPFQADVPGYTEDTGFPQFDPAAAEAAAATYQEETGQPLEFTYTFVATESGSLTAQEIQTQLSEVGITMNLDPAGDQATTINRALSGEFEAVGWRNHPGADPDTQYNWWYQGSPVNFGRIADPEVNRLLDEGRSTPEGREEIYQELNQRFGSEVYNIWTTFTIWGIGAQPNLQGILGPDLPDGGGESFRGLGTGHMVHGLWITP